jgi:hypothetical protein
MPDPTTGRASLLEHNVRYVLAKQKTLGRSLGQVDRACLSRPGPRAQAELHCKQERLQYYRCDERSVDRPL